MPSVPQSGMAAEEEERARGVSPNWHTKDADEDEDDVPPAEDDFGDILLVRQKRKRPKDLQTGFEPLANSVVVASLPFKDSPPEDSSLASPISEGPAATDSPLAGLPPESAAVAGSPLAGSHPEGPAIACAVAADPAVASSLAGSLPPAGPVPAGKKVFFFSFLFLLLVIFR